MPGLLVRSPSGEVREVTDSCFSLTLMFLSLPFSPLSPLSLSLKKKLKKKETRKKLMEVVYRPLLSMSVLHQRELPEEGA